MTQNRLFKVLALLLALVLLATVNAAQADGTLSFVRGTLFGGADYRSIGSFEVGDFNGDGFVDVVQAGNYSTGSVWTNNNDGTFTSTVSRLAVNNFVDVGDLDGDGDLDIVGTGHYGYVHLNDGLGNFTQQPRFGEPGSSRADTYYLGDIKVGDMDNDGDLDFVFANYGRYYRGLFLARNDGAANFVYERFQCGDPNKLHASLSKFDLGDVNGDGYLDLSMSGALQYGVQYATCLNDGTGQPTYLVHGGGGMLGDLDGDGDLDIIQPMNKNGSYWTVIGWNNGFGVFTTGAVNAIKFAYGIGDFNNDGLLDIAGSPGGIYLNNGNRGFVAGPQVSMGYSNNGVTDFQAVDLENDGDLDVLTVSYRKVIPNYNQLDPSTATDSDGDGVPDDQDAFPDDPNEWADSDGDGYGDNGDAFPNDPNEWADNDGDGTGDNADTDDDNDGQSDHDEAACGSDPLDGSSLSADNDGDGSPDCVDPDDDNDGHNDDVDAFPFDPTEWADNDGDGIGDNADPDDDNDGYDDVNDAFPFDPTEWADNDGDGIGDNADPDDDNDGQTDVEETTCGSDPMDGSSLSPDNDGDNSPDCVDPDDDNDGVADGDDNCQFAANVDQEDYDADGAGDACDPDDDNDGVGDDVDAYPYSDMSETVCIGDCDAGVANQVMVDGATFKDLINTAAAEAENHGDFVSEVSQLANQWKKDGLINGNEKGKITSCAARSDIP